MRKRTTCLRFKMVERCQMNQATLRSKWMSFQLQGRWARVSLRCLHWKIAAEVATRGCAVEAAVEVRKTIPNCLNSVHSWVILYTYKKGMMYHDPLIMGWFLVGFTLCHRGDEHRYFGVDKFWHLGFDQPNGALKQHRCQMGRLLFYPFGTQNGSFFIELVILIVY